jgi:hypothetical protein
MHQLRRYHGLQDVLEENDTSGTGDGLGSTWRWMTAAQARLLDDAVEV